MAVILSHCHFNELDFFFLNGLYPHLFRHLLKHVSYHLSLGHQEHCLGLNLYHSYFINWTLLYSVLLPPASLRLPAIVGNTTYKTYTLPTMHFAFPMTISANHNVFHHCPEKQWQNPTHLIRSRGLIHTFFAVILNGKNSDTFFLTIGKWKLSNVAAGLVAFSFRAWGGGQQSGRHARHPVISFHLLKKSTYANSRLDNPIRWALPLIRLLQGVPPVATVVYFWSSLVQAAPGHIGADQHISRLNEEENWCNVILRIHHCAPLNG